MTEEQQLVQCVDDAFIFEETLPFNPVSTNPYFGQSVIEENNDYIFVAFSDTFEGNYKYSTIYRYKKSDGTSTYKRVQVNSTYYYDGHKVPFIFITSSGALLLAVEHLIGNGSHNGPIEIFRWADPSDLDTYTSTVIGNSTTERLAYPFIYEYNGEIVIDTRKWGPHNRTYTKSTDDGISFGTTTLYLDMVNTYWSYARQIGNSVKGSQPVLVHLPLYNTTFNAFQYTAFLETDYVNWYELNGTNLGSLVDKTELENASTWGDITLNNNYYILQANKIFDGYIYSVGFIGTGNGTGGIVSMQIIRTNVSNGYTEYGNIFPNVFGNDVEHPDLFNICNKIYIRCINNGIVYYYKISDDINSIVLVHSENTSDFFLPAASSYNELSGIYNATENSFKLYRFSDPDLISQPSNLPTPTPTPTPTLTPTQTRTLTPTPTPTPTSTTVIPDLLNNLLSVWELDETTGSTVYDSYGSNNGTIVGASLNQSGKINSSVGFNGLSNYINMGNVLNINYNEPFTISTWYYNVASSTRVILGKMSTSSPYQGYNVLFNSLLF
jgi:hypothetical protein